NFLRGANGENLSRPSASVFDHSPRAQCFLSCSLPFVMFCRRLFALLHCSNGLLSSFMAVTSVIPIALSDISSDILYEKSAAYARIGLLKTMTECNGGIISPISPQSRQPDCA